MAGYIFLLPVRAGAVSSHQQQATRPSKGEKSTLIWHMAKLAIAPDGFKTGTEGGTESGGIVE